MGLERKSRGARIAACPTRVKAERNLARKKKKYEKRRTAMTEEGESKKGGRRPLLEEKRARTPSERVSALSKNCEDYGIRKNESSRSPPKKSRAERKEKAYYR